MAPEIRKAAEKYVRQQVGQFKGKVTKKDMNQAIRKVVEALEEVRTARAEAKRSGLDLK